MITIYWGGKVYWARDIRLGTAAGVCFVVAILASCNNPGAPGPSASQTQQIPQPERSAPAVRKVPFVPALTQAEIDETKEKIDEVKWPKSPAGKLCAKHPGWSHEVCKMVLTHHIQIGMTSEQVRASWGRPYQINRTVNESHTHEQWVVHEDSNTYLYFDDGILTTSQTSSERD